jgi:ubiquinol-cytochrome c reductase cytochrome c1 subunit
MLGRNLIKAQSATSTRALSTTVGAEQEEGSYRNFFTAALLVTAAGLGFSQRKKAEAWLFRDDIGSPNGIKGYEEQVNSVGTMHGHMYWPSEHDFQTYNSATLRRGFKVFTRICQGCHGAMHKKYDLLIDKGFDQRELIGKMVFLQKLHPAHQKYKGDYFNEWDYRQRVIHDRMWAPYFSVHQAKNANGGLWPKDLTHAEKNPGMINHVYNLMTGYHYNPPVGVDVPEGKYFNPYFDHMILGMPPQLYDGMVEYEDGTPSSAPQMAHDVSEYLQFVSRAKIPDTKTLIWFAVIMFGCWYPVSWFMTKYHFVNILSHRLEVYAVKNGGYKKFREKMFKTHKIPGNYHSQFS